MWRPVWAHFHEPSFNIFDNSIRKVTPEKIKQRKDIKAFVAFELHFRGSHPQMFQYLVSNFIAGNDEALYKITPESLRTWGDWEARKQKRSYLFKVESRMLNANAIADDPMRSQLFKLAFAEQISTETVCIVDRYWPFLDTWLQVSEGQFCFDRIHRWSKARGFVRFDHDKISQSLEELADVFAD